MTEASGPSDAEENPLIVIADCLRALKMESETKYRVHNRLLAWMIGISATLGILQTIALIVVMVGFMPQQIAKQTAVTQNQNMTVNTAEDNREKQVRDVLEGKFVRTQRMAE